MTTATYRLPALLASLAALLAAASLALPVATFELGLGRHAHQCTTDSDCGCTDDCLGDVSDDAAEQTRVAPEVQP